VYLLFADKQYEAHAKVQVVPVAANDRNFAGFSVLREGADDATAAETAAELVEASEVVDAVADRLGRDRDDLLRAVSANAEGVSNVVTVTALWADAPGAAQIANAFAAEFVARRSARFQADLQRTIAGLRDALRDVPSASRGDPAARAIATRLATLRTYVGLPDPTVEVVSDAVAPQSHASPRPVRVLAGALGTALLLAVAAASAVALGASRPLPRAAEAKREREPTRAPEPTPAPEQVAEPEPEPQAEAPSAPGTPAGAGVWSLPRLERLVEERAADFPDRVDEWRAYLFYLRDHATPEGQLPPSFDALVDEVFEDVL
jgi:capsular polysaccharide biosynthesis protein